MTEQTSTSDSSASPRPCQQMKKYIIEVRDENGTITMGEKWEQARKNNPYLFSKQEYTIDELCHYASFGQGRDNPSGPRELPAFMADAGISYREKTW